jgi:hypothetical protein
MIANVDAATRSLHGTALGDADPYRNYGPSMHGVLQAIGDGEAWQSVTAAQFDGQGSAGTRCPPSGPTPASRSRPGRPLRRFAVVPAGWGTRGA